MTTEPKYGLKRYVCEITCVPECCKEEGKDCEIPDGVPMVLASEADALIAAKDAEIAGLRDLLDAIIATTCNPVPEGRGRPIWNVAKGKLLAFHAAIDAARGKQEKRDE